jgi:hypothetical protein
MNVLLLGVVSIALWIATPSLAPAQSPTEQATRLRDARDFEGAVRVLSAQLARDPSDRVAARMLAQTLYWVGRRDEARRTYETALERHPEDHTIRVDYGRMLLETGDYRRAREVVTPVRADPQVRPWADALLGTIAYWEGDYSGARRLLRAALDAEPSLEEARRQLGEIAAASAPWISAAVGFHGDDQPMTRRTLRASAGFGVTPLIALFVEGTVGELRSGDSLAIPTTSAEVGFSSYMPALRLESEARVGMFQRGIHPSEWVGRGRLGVRLPFRFTLSGFVEREPYLYTISSMRAAIVTDAIGGRLVLATPEGWLGEAGAVRTIFPEVNRVTRAHAWLLAPLVRATGVTVRAGYGASMQDSEMSRWAGRIAGPPRPDGTLPGYYSPYYTPLGVRTHSIIADMDAKAASAVRVQVGGSYGFFGIEQAPIWRVGPPSTGLTLVHSTEPRRFSPWTVRGGLDVTPNSDLSLGLGGEASRTAFYTSRTARAHITYRFASAAARRATRR